MITVSEEFKTAMKTPGREAKAYLNDSGNMINQDDDLQTIKLTASSSICKTVMRGAVVTYLGSHNYLDKYVNLGLGVVLPNESIEYLDYGSFKVVKVETNKANASSKITLYDKMYEALQPYDLEPIYDITYPTTVLGLLEAICVRFSWTLATTEFPNDDYGIPADLFLDQKLTFRDVLEQIAEVSGAIIEFNNSDELVVRNISDTILETLDKNSLNKLILEPTYGPITSVVLSRQPQEDNIAQTI